MKPRALVIEDDPDIREAVSDILDSLNHDHDYADSVESAREHLGREEYTYILLDLEIPVIARRNLPRVQNGENLLEEIVRCRGLRVCPIVIVMTAHGTDGPDLAVDVMKRGAADYVTKPFKTAGRTLDKSIREALARQGMASLPLPNPHDKASSKITSATSTAPKLFDGGMMVFYPDRVELRGAIICDGNRKSKRQRKVLELFRIKVGARFARYDCERLAGELEITSGQSGVPAFIRSLRNRIKKALLEKVSIESQDKDVICYDCGYCLSEKLTVQDGGEVDSGHDHGHHGEILRLNVPNVRDPDVPNDEAARRREWIVRQLQAGVGLKAPMVAAQFKRTRKTAQRDLDALRDEGKIEFVGDPRTGYYRLVAGK